VGTSTVSCAAADVHERVEPGEIEEQHALFAAIRGHVLDEQRRLHAPRLALLSRLGHVHVRRPAADLGEDGAVGAQHVRHEPGGSAAAHAQAQSPEPR
jgi:hypothetical protein